MLVLSSVLLLLLAGSAAAADEMAPVVDVPEDIPGADVIVFYGDAYAFDASNSIDDTGIVDYMWEFNDGATPVVLSDTSGKVTYTFSNYGQTWVIVHAWDAAGNEGLGYFAIDVVEKLTTDTVIQDQVGVLPHSLYLDGSDLTITNSTLYMDDGAGPGPHAGGAGAPEHMGESLTPDGDFAGYWRPMYGDSWYYGDLYLDTNTKMYGEASVRVSNMYYWAGIEYVFNSPVDLTQYNAFTFWWHSDCYYWSDLFFDNMYFYSSTSTYPYIYQQAGMRHQGGYAAYRDWYGYTVPLDLSNTGRNYMSGMYDLSSVKMIRLQSYYWIYNGKYRGFDFWFDNVGFSNVEWADSMTESTSPSGDYAGRWSSSYSSPSISSRSYVGDYSIYFPMTRYRYIDFYYDFNSPTDLSTARGMRFFNYHSGGSYA
nr:PKD domain-containing protein [Thermoplasmata archaeon]NIS10690.1 PKD domain-containing protein [Thermoplasmata archaeon]NIS18640.1 PKD domain-containing protein [Thermoplasmata archaeon]NIT75642.1 PKD domain-containing protein [Thermoplasmata archaeon]NIU47794.1 PKD domain-containing protein [Thermoplasmata archaeon]